MNNIKHLRILLFNALLCAQQVTPLTMKQAVDMALAPDGSARLRLMREAQALAEARKNTVKGALLPNLDAAVTETDFTRNLKAFGFAVNVPGFKSPSLVGPLSNFDMRVTASQSIFDFSAWKRLDAAKAAMAVAEAEKEATSNQVADAVAHAYLSALRHKAALDVIKANIDLASKLVKLANDQKEAGTGTGIEVTRAKVQLSNEEQRLSIADLEYEQAKLQLQRVIGMGFTTPVELTDGLSNPTPRPTLEEALESARQYRPDWLAQKRREQQASLNYQAVRAERYPTLGAFGDYGALGISPGGALATRTIGVTLKVPIFDGGRRDSRRAENSINLRQEAIRTKDIQQQVELEVRLALGAVKGTEGQVKVAEEGLTLSQQELEQAERRYRGGVTSSVELVDAQARIARARDNRTLALYQNNLARIELATAMGALHRILQ